MTFNATELAGFGWSHHFQSQLETDELAHFIPVRVTAVHRNRLDVANPDLDLSIPPFTVEDPEEGAATIGDWLLLQGDNLAAARLLRRKTFFKRKAAGLAQQVQPIAANIDTLLIVTSCNEEFNVARLERYLALARASGATPVVALTKADLAEDANAFVARALKLLPGLHVECVDARASATAELLRPWCAHGQTLALVGSSGVGKSTLVNTLLARSVQETAGIREQDAHGRHTTTDRSLHRLAGGGWLLDTPGMRELQLADSEDGLEHVFADIVALVGGCRFADCGHDSEPGCAVRAAIDEGRIDPDRLRRYRKLVSEDSRNSASLRERRAGARSFGRMARRLMQEKEARRRT